MNTEDKYSKVIGTLKGNRPVLENRERLTDDIMREIRASSEKFPLQERLGYYLFGWVNVYWLRGTMAVAAILLIGFFIFQQVVIADRLSNMEEQLVQTVNTINGNRPDRDLGGNQKILMKTVLKDQMMDDSITVSRSDLEELLNNYQELRENYEIDQKSVGLNPFIHKRIIQSMEGEADNNEL